MVFLRYMHLDSNAHYRLNERRKWETDFRFEFRSFDLVCCFL